MAAPLLLYILERVWRLFSPFALRGELLDVELMRGKDAVTVLRVRRPRGFYYKWVLTLETHRRFSLGR